MVVVRGWASDLGLEVEVDLTAVVAAVLLFAALTFDGRFGAAVGVADSF